MRRAGDPVLGMREGGMSGVRPLFYVWVVVMPVPEVKKARRGPGLVDGSQGLIWSTFKLSYLRLPHGGVHGACGHRGLELGPWLGVIRIRLAGFSSHSTE